VASEVKHFAPPKIKVLPPWRCRSKNWTINRLHCYVARILTFWSSPSHSLKGTLHQFSSSLILIIVVAMNSFSMVFPVAVVLTW